MGRRRACHRGQRDGFSHGDGGGERMPDAHILAAADGAEDESGLVGRHGIGEHRVGPRLAEFGVDRGLKECLAQVVGDWAFGRLGAICRVNGWCARLRRCE